MSDEPLSFNQAVAGISDFIEVAVHTILYVRQVYPAELFIRRKKYDTPVFQSRHPALNEYISGAIKALSEEMHQGTVEKVVVVIKNKEHVALERFIFAIENMIELGQLNLGELKDGTAPSVSQSKDPPPWIPADTQHTTSGVSQEAELYMIRAVNTGVIDVSLAVQESAEKLKLERERLKEQQLEAKKVAESLKKAKVKPPE
ncbi:hypothetical protein EST38_g6690 [Candolleomyces aberdarensis]|uniref:HORMA domain-containing protein n=1 Tax=Candolleomyces aberdarensis TaxID=2316362 RepID=A0A4Q2DJ32_9AGAR|nr:hypothetical protein EST38_g6690 [Candolleomyces aberdarensis]